MSKQINKITKEKLAKCLEEFGYKVTKQSSDGTYTLVRIPNNDSTQYWLFSDRIEHRQELADRYSIVSYFNYDDCFLRVEDTALSIIVKGLQHHGVFITFFNFETKA